MPALSEYLTTNNALNPTWIYGTHDAVCLIFEDLATAKRFKQDQFFLHHHTLFQGAPEEVGGYFILKLNKAPWDRICDGPLRRYHSMQLPTDETKEPFLLRYGIVKDASYFPISANHREFLGEVVPIDSSLKKLAENETIKAIDIDNELKARGLQIIHRRDKDKSKMELRKIKHEITLHFNSRTNAERFLIDSQLKPRDIIEIRGSFKKDGTRVTTFDILLTEQEYDSVFTLPYRYFNQPSQQLTFNEIQQKHRSQEDYETFPVNPEPLTLRGNPPPPLSIPLVSSSDSVSTSSGDTPLSSALEGAEEQSLTEDLSDWMRLIKSSSPLGVDTHKLDPTLRLIIAKFGNNYVDIPSEIRPLFYLQILHKQIENADSLDLTNYETLKRFLSTTKPGKELDLEQQCLLILLYQVRNEPEHVKAMMERLPKDKSELPIYLEDEVEALRNKIANEPSTPKGLGR